MKIRFKLLLVNIVLGIAGLILVVPVLFLTNGFWGKGPYITDQLLAGVIIILYIFCLLIGNYLAVHSKKKLFVLIQLFTTRLKGCSHRRPITTIMIGLIIVLVLINWVPWIYYYFIPKYSPSELETISITVWDGLSNKEKFRIGQSFYIIWKGSEVGFYDANDYVQLIERNVGPNSGTYDNVDHIVFYSLSGT